MIHIQVAQKPVPKARPRFNRFSGHTYTPPTTKTFESHIKKAAKKVIKTPLKGALYIHIDFHFQKAKSSKLDMHIKRPDIDNLIKGVLDGLNRVAFIDDAQVVALYSEKKFSDRDGVDIYIREHSNDQEDSAKKESTSAGSKEQGRTTHKIQ